MSTNLLVIIILGALCLMSWVFLLCMMGVQARERRDLYAMIKADNLQEYDTQKRMEAITRPATADDVAEDEIEETQDVEEPPVDLAKCANAVSSLRKL